MRPFKKRRAPHKTINGRKKRIYIHIMEDFLGRELEPNEHVYHKDGDATNNLLSNLVIIIKKPRK